MSSWASGTVRIFCAARPRLNNDEGRWPTEVQVMSIAGSFALRIRAGAVAVAFIVGRVSDGAEEAALEIAGKWGATPVGFDQKAGEISGDSPNRNRLTTCTTRICACIQWTRIGFGRRDGRFPDAVV